MHYHIDPFLYNSKELWGILPVPVTMLSIDPQEASLNFYFAKSHWSAKVNLRFGSTLSVPQSYSFAEEPLCPNMNTLLTYLTRVLDLFETWELDLAYVSNIDFA